MRFFSPKVKSTTTTNNNKEMYVHTRKKRRKKNKAQSQMITENVCCSVRGKTYDYCLTKLDQKWNSDDMCKYVCGKFVQAHGVLS